MKQFLLTALIGFCAAFGTALSAEDEQTNLPDSSVPYEHLDCGWWRERQEQNRAAIERGNIGLLLIGDSITHGMNEVASNYQGYYYGDRN